VSDEFDELLDDQGAPDTPAEVMEQMVRESAAEQEHVLHAGTPMPPSPLVTAASLLDPEADQDEGDFEPGMYKGFEILHESEWPRVQRHLHLPRRFYVRHNDAVGMVPWAGSMIIWQWDEAWEQGGYKTEVQSFLKEEKKETKKK
jgi:hypothetical protein